MARRQVLILFVLSAFLALPLQAALECDGSSKGVTLHAHEDSASAWRWQAKLSGAGVTVETECRHSEAWVSVLSRRSRQAQPKGASNGAGESQGRVVTTTGCAERPAAADTEPA